MIILLCGPPASGKSVIARGLSKKLKDCKLLISDEFKRKTYWHMFEEAKKYAGKVKYLILDGTFYKQKWRNEIRKIANRRGESVFLIYITCTLKTCLERNKKRKEKIEERAIHIIYNEFEKPKNYDMLINTDVLNKKEAIKKILNKLKP